MSTRAEIMQARGHYTCPAWCLQPDDEDNTEEHQGAWTTYTTAVGVTVKVRPVIGWGETGQGAGEIDVRLAGDYLDEDGQPGLRLTSEIRYEISKLVDQAETQIENWAVFVPPRDWQWAYPGAEDDEAAAEEEEDG